MLLEVLFGSSMLLTGILLIFVVAKPLTPGHLRRVQFSLIATFVSEFSHVFLGFKLWLYYVLSNASFWSKQWYQYMYWLDVCICLGFWALFLQSYFARHPVYEATKFYRNQTSTEPPTFFSFSFFFRFMNPIYQASRGILVQDDICYATDSELESNKQNRRSWSLDILQHASFPKNRPVLIYVHGGLWSSGSKEKRPPFLPFLALKQYVVVAINYRLAPKVKFEDQIVDVKRAIRWVKSNIATFGGDPSFVAIAGSSSGAHLASVCAMTPNLAKFQPGFEDADTSVQALVSISGIYDVTNFKNKFGYKFQHWFKQICGEYSDDFYREISPSWRLREAEDKKSLISASEQDKKGHLMPPTMIIHARNDVLAPVSHTREFLKLFKQSVADPRLCYIELPNANHFFYSLSTPRSHALSYGIEPFLRWCSEQRKIQ